MKAFLGPTVSVALGIWLLYASAVAVALVQLVSAPEPSSAPSDHPPASGSPAALIEKHDCCSGDAPLDMVGKVPAHAIVATGATPRYVGPDLTGKALEQVFAGEDHGLVVYAFCR
ncbi:hypothetical protein WBG06_17040 [Nocardioides sp. CCNWLW239]|uniref:hypothetical protein n=1 Tax=Nocardioides sp. CCNWLW239 TaxID=3128902 RepID=UPI003016FDAD